MKKVFSGIKPTGDMHIGNLIGAILQWVNIQDQYENFFCIVDLHSLTQPVDPKELSELTYSITSWYLAAGIDPQKSTIFIQSQNPNHTELSWILNCHTSVGELNRMTQYKEKKSQADATNAGILNYPVLMAADILLYDTDFVPVGDDQKQHVELTRNIAQRFNNRYGDVFKIPEYMPPVIGSRIMSLQKPDNKMSKSVSDTNGTIFLLDSPEEIANKIKTAVTDSDNQVIMHENKPGVSNLITIYSALAEISPEEIIKKYDGLGYKVFKEDLTQVVTQKLKPLQEKYREIYKSEYLNDVIKSGLHKARQTSNMKMELIKKKIGLI